jgi:uncharacterized protein (UPF0261 family)
LSTIVVIATLDTKGEEASVLGAELTRKGLEPLILDSAPWRWSESSADRERATVVAEAGDAIAVEVERLHAEGAIAGAVVLGGATGAALGCPSFARLPLGFPKVLVSPVVCGETSEYVGTADAVLVAPVVDFVGRNAYADHALTRAAALVAALVDEGGSYPQEPRTHLAVTAFGVTSPLVARLQELLSADGLRATVFSANGAGGDAYERFLAERLVIGGVDVTTSELADELCGGVLPAGPERLRTAARLGMPQVVLPGGIDFINFRDPESVPARYSDRAQVRHTPTVTLVRTDASENEALGRTIAARLDDAKRPATVIVPLGGFSSLSVAGGPFFDPEADRAFLEALRKSLPGRHRLAEIAAPINSDAVAGAIVEEVSAWARVQVA